MFRVTLASMLMGALSVAFLYLILEKVLERAWVGSASPWYWKGPACLGALCFAFSFQHWFQSGGAKGGIYALNTLLTLGMLYLLFQMREQGWFLKSLFLMSFVYGLGLANHWPHQIALVPAYLWLFWDGCKKKRATVEEAGLRNFSQSFDLATQCQALFRAIGFSNLFRAATFGFLSLSIYLYLPLRAHLNPVENWGNPQNFQRFRDVILRKSFQGNEGSLATLPRNLNWFLLQVRHEFGDFFTFLVLALAVAGIYWLWRRQRSAAIGFFLVGSFIFASVVVAYNPAEGKEAPMDNFLILFFLTLACFMATGAASLVEWAVVRWPRRETLWLSTTLCLTLGILPLVLNYGVSDQSRYVSAYDFGLNILKTADHNGVVICDGDIDMYPLWYLQCVQGLRPEVAYFVPHLLLDYPWYQESIFQRWPFLRVPSDNNNGKLVQDILVAHGLEKAFYCTDVTQFPWAQEFCFPNGLLWRINVGRPSLDQTVLAARTNVLWSGYRIRDLYSDYYNDDIRDSYGIQFQNIGYFYNLHEMPAPAIWNFENALKLRRSSGYALIHLMLGDAYLMESKAQQAIQNYEETLKRDSGNPFAYARMGRCFLLMKDWTRAEKEFQNSLASDPGQKEALDGLRELNRLRNK